MKEHLDSLIKFQPTRVMTGDTKLIDLISLSIYKKHLKKCKFSDEETEELSKYLKYLGENVDNLSSLRKILSENPTSLIINESDNSKALLIVIQGLFREPGSARQQKISFDNNN